MTLCNREQLPSNYVTLFQMVASLLQVPRFARDDGVTLEGWRFLLASLGMKIIKFLFTRRNTTTCE